jgi:hypothetical protein
MNAENNHVFHTSSLNGAKPGHDLHGWRWIVLSKLAMLAAFIGTSLVGIAGNALLDGRDAYRVTALAVGGALLLTIALRGLARVVRRAERETLQRAPAKVRTSPAAAQARITGITPTL